MISCRSLDYSAPLSTADLPVPHLTLEPLTDAKVREFLGRYSPGCADDIWEQIRDTPLLDTVRWPFFLRLLVDGVDDEGRLPGGIPALFTAQVRRALVREVLADNPRFQADGLIDARERARIVKRHGWGGQYELPYRGRLIPNLTRLAYSMQDAALEGESSQIRIRFEEATDLLSPEPGELIIEMATDLGVLDEDNLSNDVLFRHQLLQEYFSGRALATAPEPERVAVEWRGCNAEPPLDDVVDSLGPGERLPPLPETGWEVTSLFAAAMARDPADFVQRLCDSNLALAGRAAALPEVLERLSPEFVDALRGSLVERSRDPDADLRDRLSCAWTLGDLGDPRLTPCDGPYGRYMMPDLKRIPGGPYPVGYDDPIEGTVLHTGEPKLREAHVPQHEVDIDPFRVGTYPVTNGEWRLFMDSGGYQDERWWDTEDSQSWRCGELPDTEAMQNNRKWRGYFLENPGLLHTLDEEGHLPDDVIVRWGEWLQMDEEAFEAAIEERWQGRVESAPRYWDEARFRHPLQPVVGVSWYEARAYCSWLSAQTGLAFRLPTEVEWEAAARGPRDHIDNVDSDEISWVGNFHESHIGRPTPIGVFPAGDSCWGVADLLGNTWEWTLSVFGPEPEVPAFAYPYRHDDGREDPHAGSDERRVRRGGAWNDGGSRKPEIYTIARGEACPVDRRTSCGFRVAADG